MALNDYCKNNISDEDCYRCMKHGIILTCPMGCKDFEDESKIKQEEKQLT